MDREWLTSTWKSQYDGIEFHAPSQSEGRQLFKNAEVDLHNGKKLQVPKAIPPPRGRPPKNAGKRLRSFYELGPCKKRKRSYRLWALQRIRAYCQGLHLSAVFY